MRFDTGLFTTYELHDVHLSVQTRTNNHIYQFDSTLSVLL